MLLQVLKHLGAKYKFAVVDGQSERRYDNQNRSLEAFYGVGLKLGVICRPQMQIAATNGANSVEGALQ